MASESAETLQHLHTLTLKVCLLYIKQIKISNNKMYSTNLLQLLHRGKRVARQECKTTQGMCSIMSRKHHRWWTVSLGVQKVGLVLRHDSTSISSESSLQFSALNEGKRSLGAETNKLSTYKWIKMQKIIFNNYIQSIKEKTWDSTPNSVCVCVEVPVTERQNPNCSRRRILVCFRITVNYSWWVCGTELPIRCGQVNSGPFTQIWSHSVSL